MITMSFTLNLVEVLHWSHWAEKLIMQRGVVDSKFSTGLLSCISLPPHLSPAPLTSPCPSLCSQCPAKFIYPIIVLSRHVSSTVSTPQLCLAPACHRTETLPPATTAVKRSDTWALQTGACVLIIYYLAALCILTVALSRPTFNLVSVVIMTISEPSSA